MKSFQKIDIVARDLSDEVQKSTYLASKDKTEKRRALLEKDYPDPDKLRETAGLIKQHTLEHLDLYLAQAEASLKAAGAEVHFAVDADSANATALKIMQDNGAKRMVKSKSMVTEETHLLPYLEQNGMEVIETDLGEFIVQIDGDHPSHIVQPIIHKNRRDIAKSFEREGLGDYNDDPETITRRARWLLRLSHPKLDQ